MGNTIESFNKNLFKQSTPNRWTNTDLPAKGFDFIFAAFSFTDHLVTLLLVCYERKHCDNQSYNAYFAS